MTEFNSNHLGFFNYQNFGPYSGIRLHRQSSPHSVMPAKIFAEFLIKFP